MPKPIQQYLSPLAFIVTLAVVVGCGDKNASETSALAADPTQETEPEALDEDGEDAIAAAYKRQAIAEKAKDALLERLSGRLVATMQSDGPVAAIDVCSKEAVTIAEAVGKEYGVEIGRTSFKLRNPANAPRDWVKPFVENRTDTPQHVELDDETLGVLFPIYLKVKCLMCHGQPSDILDAVKPELAKLYPDDDATGFHLDELRGWFWVEVPADATLVTAAIDK